MAPFDNLIAGRRRTNTVFGFDYAHEQFLPKEKRKYGTCVLPVLRGETLIGRVDPRLDKEQRRLVVNSVHAEPGAP
ncbi:MAG: winged helix DNA-binding domain-containing protein [Nitrososphaerota archaeon]|nr:winged helix DNA-binding domain-containing protein [Nitrososphaerota archaeon]MDG7014211.1 winged helix DNA-binding domain-containing protein [Nitrososphaerota archaeon]MDG7025554.1 winged helix DNA-binding domain-containing protein [Nitrososphaerota archaeon]